jgi:hypothetical protein
MKRALAALAALSVTALGGQYAFADQIPGSTTVVAAWQIGAYDDGGRFSHCAMSTPYVSGITMYFSVSGNFSWRVGWSHKAWNFTKGQGVDLALFVDGAGPFNLHAVAVTKDLAIAELPTKAAVFDLMRKGYRMTVQAVGNTYAFNLDGTFAALTETLACASRYSGVAAAPLSPPPPPPPPAPMVPRTLPTNGVVGEITADQRLEATKLVANIFAQGDMTGFRILSAKEMAELDNEAISRAHVAWRADGILGTLRILPATKNKIPLSDFSAAIISDDAKACKGKFASGSTPDDKSPSVLRLFTACSEGGKTYEYRYTVLPVGDGTHYLFATGGIADPDNSGSRVAKVESALRQAVYDVMKK